jgi:hypothetical protein
MTLQVPDIASGGKQSVPWAAVSAEPDVFLDPEYMPEGVLFKDPSRLHRDDCKKVLEHWKDRQDDPDEDVTFSFKCFLNSRKEVCPKKVLKPRPPMTQGSPIKKKKQRKGKGKGKGKRVVRPPTPGVHRSPDDTEDETGQHLHDLDNQQEGEDEIEDEIRQRLLDLDNQQEEDEDDNDNRIASDPVSVVLHVKIA